MTLHKMARHKGQIGLTLLEVMVVVAIMGIVVVFAAPSISKWTERNRLNGIARKIVNDLHFCRQKAISENKYYIIDFQSGTPILYTIKFGDSLGTYTDLKTITVPDSSNFITFTASGDPVFNYRGMSNSTVTLTIANADNVVKTISVNLGGKISSS